MSARAPIRQLATHEVVNQATPLEDRNLYDLDAALSEGLHREGAAWAEDAVRALGGVAGSAETQRLAVQANRSGPELRAFDPYGHRIDEVEFHPAYHALMDIGITHGVHALAWNAARPGGHVAHAALQVLMTQAEPGVCCPLAMTYAAVPALRHEPALAEEWTPRILSTQYDPRFIPAGEKDGVTFGMAMTEKQGGSDVRSNTTRAEPLGNGAADGEAALWGHKWFCSAPMSDAFLTLAQTEQGLTCFLVPRWMPDGERNRVHIQRLKDKLGNRSNASAEIEYHGAWARRVGEPGRGVRTIIEMVHHTRLDASCAPAGLMRQALTHAAHHAAHRAAFGRTLTDQPLMRNVLADLALESEAAIALVLRVARAFDAGGDPEAAALGRLATPVMKYWVNKRTPNLVYEAMECLGGGGYVEESILSRLYREAPVNSIWEGSGNVICLDVLRAMQREPATVEAFMSEVRQTAGADRRLDRATDDLAALLRADIGEADARRLTERIALVLQAALLVRHAPAEVADAFCASRLADDWGRTYGTLPADTDFGAILQRALPELG